MYMYVQLNAWSVSEIFVFVNLHLSVQAIAKNLYIAYILEKEHFTVKHCNIYASNSLIKQHTKSIICICNNAILYNQVSLIFGNLL